MKISTSKPTIVFIVGTLFSGSTLLGNSLNGSIEATFIGEFDRLRCFDQYPNHSSYYVDRSIISEINGINCSFWNPLFLQKISKLSIPDAFVEVVERAGTSVVIDGSKNVNWLTSVYPELSEKFKIAAIISVRNPFAFSCSYMGAHNVEPWFAAQVWKNTYRHIIRCLFSRGIPTIVVRYEDFSLNPMDILKQQLCPFLNFSFYERMMTYWEAPNYSLGGNAGAYLKFKDLQADHLKNTDDSWKPEYYQDKPFGGWISQRWIQLLNLSQVSEIASVDGVMSTAFDLGYDLSNLIRTHYKKQMNIDIKNKD